MRSRPTARSEGASTSDRRRRAAAHPSSRVLPRKSRATASRPLTTFGASVACAGGGSGSKLKGLKPLPLCPPGQQLEMTGVKHDSGHLGNDVSDTVSMTAPDANLGYCGHNCRHVLCVCMVAAEGYPAILVGREPKWAGVPQGRTCGTYLGVDVPQERLQHGRRQQAARLPRCSGARHRQHPGPRLQQRSRFRTVKLVTQRRLYGRAYYDWDAAAFKWIKAQYR
jgi:hypothetical protein